MNAYCSLLDYHLIFSKLFDLICACAFLRVILNDNFVKYFNKLDTRDFDVFYKVDFEDYLLLILWETLILL